MADILEVLQAICVARGYTLEELENMRMKKAKERGGFKNHIFLEYVEESKQTEKFGLFNIVYYKVTYDRCRRSER